MLNNIILKHYIITRHSITHNWKYEWSYGRIRKLWQKFLIFFVSVEGQDFKGFRRSLLPEKHRVIWLGLNFFYLWKVEHSIQWLAQ